MSGYLQRLAGSVIQPKETVRPLLGSVFSAPITRHPAEAIFSADEPPGPHETESSLVSRTPELQRQEETLLSQREIVTPMPAKTASPATSKPNVMRPLVPLQQHLPSTMVERGDEAKIPAHDAAEAHAEVFIPLVARGAAGAIQNSIVDGPSNFSSPRPRDKRRTEASSAAQREPDEIQIHIGRIEISAVPQAPPTTVAKAARTSSSLDEYLKRRDRRSQ